MLSRQGANLQVKGTFAWEWDLTSHGHALKLSWSPFFRPIICLLSTWVLGLHQTGALTSERCEPPEMELLDQ